MELKPEEITKIIRSQIKNYENKLQTSETGTVILSGDGIAKVSGLCARMGINVEDVTQSILQGMFAMIMLVDTTDCELSFDALSALLKEKGAEKNLSIQIQREDIFNSMHKI